MTSGFRRDRGTYCMTVAQLREHRQWAEHPFIKVRHTGKHGMTVKWATDDAERRAMELVDSGQTGRHVISEDCVIDILGLGDEDSVNIHEGPGIADDIRPFPAH